MNHSDFNTELKNLKNLLNEKEKKIKELEKEANIYRIIQEISSEAVFLETLDGKIVDVNEKAMQMLGYTRDELLNLKVPDIVPDNIKKQLPKLYEKTFLKNGIVTESENLKKDGTIFPVELSAKLFSFKNDDYLYVCVRDISTRKKLEKELKEALENQLRINDELMETTLKLKESEEKYRNLIENSNDGIYILKKERFILVNKKFEEILEYSFDELNSPDFHFENTIAPEDRQMIRIRGEKIRKGEDIPSNYRFRCITKSGAKKDLETSVSYLKYEGEIATHGIVRDITEQKRLEEQLLQSQKMDAIGKLAGGIAHDFNNLLTGILGYAELLASKSKDNSEKRAAEIILESSRKAAKLTSQLLNFSRRGEFDPEPMNINISVENVLVLIDKVIHKNIDISTELDPQIKIIEADSGQVDQALMNVIMNAFDAMPKGGHLSISTSNTFLDQKYCSSFPDLKQGDYVKLSVTDTGSGMTNVAKSRAFEPFFSTKSKGEGTGLGLSTVYGIIKNHSGHINVYSELNQGTTINIYIPVSKLKRELYSPKKVEFIKGNETILLIDDEKLVRSVGKDILTDLGYKVHLASSGKQGIKLLEKHMDSIRLVLLDMIMPEMDGETVYKELKKINPDIKIIIVSGYSQNGTAEKIVKKEKTVFVQKPFQMKELSEALRKVLGSPGNS
ncbi:PAS domain S-box protein [candidate division KSB1 bacterium]